MYHTMRALVNASPNTAEVAQIPIPEPGPGEIRVKVHSVALNPVDPLYTAIPPSAQFGRVIGSDVSGIIDKLGPDQIPSVNRTVGDRVAGLLQGATSGDIVARPGGFAEYAILESDLAINIGHELSFDEGAALPLGVLTAAQALFVRLGLPAPFPNPFDNAPLTTPPSGRVPTLLIYSASTSIGLYAVQLAKLVPSSPPIRVIVTASPANHALLLSLGADLAFDYGSPTWAEDVKKASGGGVDWAFDCISEDATTGRISQTFIEGEAAAGNAGEKRVAVIRKAAWDAKIVRQDVVPLYGAAWVGLGHEIIYNGVPMLADATHRVFTVAFFAWLSSQSIFPIKPNPVRLMPGGLDKILPDGFALMGSGKVADREHGEKRTEEWMRKISAEKLVYRI